MLATCRVVLVAILLAAQPALAAAQGHVIPRPCPAPRCVPPPCQQPRCDRPPSEWIERTRSDVRATLRGRVLSVEVREKFVNRGGALGEADYVFPLPRDAAFRDLALTIGGEPVTGEVMDASKARAIYEAIVRQQRDPALVEWMGHGMLRARVFPLPPGEEREVTVRFDAVVPLEGDALRIGYVTARAPSSGALQVHDDGPRPGGVQRSPAGGATSFVLEYNHSEFPRSPFSPTHRLDVRDDGERRRVHASGSAREVVLLVPAGARRAGSTGVLAHRPEPDEAGYLMLTVTPPDIRSASLPRDLTFVVDVSGSMRGEKIEQARAAGERLLETLRPQDRFRIVAFSTDVSSFRPNFAPATPATVHEARSFLRGLTASGGTNISGAMDEALDVPSPADRLPLVLLLTDGAPTVGERNADAIAERTAAARGRARVFTIGLGSDVNSALVERLALQAQGTPYFITPSENVERTVAALGSRLTNPVLTDVTVSAQGVRLSGVLPSGEQDLYAGQELVLLARWEGGGERDAEIRIQGMGANGVVSWSTRVRLPARSRDHAFVGRLWATRRVGWLSAERRLRGPSAELDEEIRELGTRFGIPTELTSYLVLEPGMERLANQSVSAPPPASAPGSVRLMGSTGRASGASAADMSATTVTSSEAEFRKARHAAEQRSVVSAEQLDDRVAKDVEVVVVAGHTMRRQPDGRWIDARSDAGLPRIQVRAYSAAWFEVAERLPELGPVLALGERVEVVLSGVVLVVGKSGLEQLGRSEWSRLTGQ